VARERASRPQLILVAVQSIDGYLTRHDQPGAASFASEADQVHFRALMRTVDSALFGGSTYRADRAHIRPDLRPDLLRVVWTREPAAFAGEEVPGQLEFSAAEPAELLTDLARRGRRRCALVGGEAMIGRFLADDLVDELQLTVEPYMFGSGRRLNATTVDLAFELADVVRLSERTLLLRYLRAR
jgi:dihydrofolate reductase